MRHLMFLLLFLSSLPTSAQSLAWNPNPENAAETFKQTEQSPRQQLADNHYYRNTKGLGGMVSGGLIFVTGLVFHAVGSAQSYDEGDADHFLGTAFMLGGAITFITAAVVHNAHGHDGDRISLIGDENKIGLAYNFK